MRALLVLACFLLAFAMPIHAQPTTPPCRCGTMLGLGAAVVIGAGITTLIITQIGSSSPPPPALPHTHQHGHG